MVKDKEDMGGIGGRRGREDMMYSNSELKTNKMFSIAPSLSCTYMHQIFVTKEALS